MSNSVTHDGLKVVEGDVLYMADNIHPVVVLAIYQNQDETPRTVLGYGGNEYLMDCATLLSSIRSGYFSSIGTPSYQKGARFRQPNTDTLVSVIGVSDRRSNGQFHYFVQHVDANGAITYTTLDETTLKGYPRETSVVVRPFPTDLPTDADIIELVIE